MLKPSSAVYHNRLADVYYSIGDEEHVRLARKHYTLSLNQQAPEINVRLLLCHCSSFLFSLFVMSLPLSLIHL